MILKSNRRTNKPGVDMGIYDIEDFERGKIHDLVSTICTSLDKMIQIKVSFLSDDADRVPTRWYDSYEEYIKDKDSFELPRMESVDIEGEVQSQRLGVFIDMADKIMVISASTPDKEAEYFQTVNSRLAR